MINVISIEKYASLINNAQDNSYQMLQATPIEDTEIVSLIPRAWGEMLERAPNDLYIPFSGDDSALYIVDPESNSIVAFTMYSDRRGTASIWVTLSWTHPDYRGQGLNAALWQALVDIAADQGRHSIFGSTSAGNETMLRAMERQGRELVGHTFKYSLLVE